MNVEAKAADLDLAEAAFEAFNRRGESSVAEVAAMVAEYRHASVTRALDLPGESPDPAPGRYTHRLRLMETGMGWMVQLRRWFRWVPAVFVDGEVLYCKTEQLAAKAARKHFWVGSTLELEAGPSKERRGAARANENAASRELTDELAKLRAEREELRELLWWVEAKLQPELNLSNYHHQQVCELNANATEAVLAIRAALAEKEE